MSQSNCLARWPKDWPIQAEDPSSESLEQPALLPGNTLRACSGSDVHWARGASVKFSSSSSSSAAAKYLALLPGVLSLNPPAEPSGTNGDAKREDDAQGRARPAAENPNGSPTYATLVHSDAEDHAAKRPESTVSATKAPPPAAASSGTKDPPLAPAVLGRLARPDPHSAVLRLRGGLQLQGRHVKTSGKFLILTMQPRKKRVVCKHVFESVMVFGNPTALSPGDEQLAETAGGAAAPSNALHHYGGSSRTVDGGGGGSSGGGRGMKGRHSVSDRSTPKPVPVPVVHRLPSAAKGLSGRGDESESSSSSSDVDDTLPPAQTLSRRRSSRTASQKPVRYSDALEQSSVDDEGNDGNRSSDAEARNPAAKIGSSDKSCNFSDDDRKPASRKSAPKPKPPPPPTRKSTTASKSRPAIGKAAPSRTSEVESEDSPDDNSTKNDLPVSATGKRKSALKQSYGPRLSSKSKVASNRASDSGEEEQRDASVTPTNATPLKPRNRPQRSATRRSARPERAAVEGPSSSESGDSDVGIAFKRLPRSTSRRRAPPPPPRPAEDDSSSSESGDSEIQQASEPVNSTNGKPDQSATTLRHVSRPKAAKQAIIEGSDSSDKAPPTNSRMAPESLAGSSDRGAARRTAARPLAMRSARPTRAVSAIPSQTRVAGFAKDDSDDDGGGGDAQPSPTTAVEAGKRKQRTFGGSGGETSPRFKKKEVAETVDMTQDSDDSSAMDRDVSTDVPSGRVRNGVAKRKIRQPPQSVSETMDEPTPQSDKHLLSKASLRKVSSRGNSASPHPSTPLRFRRSPPKPKRKLSILDYAKDEGFL